MGFQIKDKEGVALTLRSLDEEVALFWEVELEERMYAKPFIKGGTQEGSRGPNWFNMVGFHIHLRNNVKDYSENKQVDWADVLGLLMGDWLMSKDREASWEKPHYYQPYIDLVKHWEDKGYQAWSVVG